MEARIISYHNLVFGVNRRGRFYLKAEDHWHEGDEVSPPDDRVEQVGEQVAPDVKGK